ncbi:MAG: DUF1573 domain-containing protein [Saprospiraceae bacterium]|nr:DUF1573 domain-containing protein [Saprospiraceae bacterium]
MKKVLSLVMFLSVAMFAMAQVEAVPAPAAMDGPIMTFDAMELDYGLIEQGSEPLRTFHFKNTGTKDLLVTNAKGSCGCTVPKSPTTAIAPGGSDVIEVRYDTNRIGKFTKTVTITTNEPEGQNSRILTIKGEVKKLEEEPAHPTNNDNTITPTLKKG